MGKYAARLRDGLALANAHAQDVMERIQAELEFAETLCEWHPDKADDWQGPVEQAVERVTAAGADDLAGAVREAEEMLAPLTEAAKEYTIYCVGHAHIDMNWQWSWPETVAVTNDSFATVLRLMEEFPEFHFSQSQASVYAIVEKYNPAMLERIAERVREGRWEVTASHWVEGDKNLAGGESLCRHLLYTRQYMQGLFGLSPEDVPIDWSPDTFGHAATVPTYLVRGGVKYLYLHRPGVNGPARPGAFWWQAPDGSRVLVRNDMDLGYNGEITPAIAKPLVKFRQATGLPFVMFVYGVGDHGGGPTRRDLHRALEMDQWPVFPRVVLSTARAFYERLEGEAQDLPTLDCELNCEFAGCYTTQTLIKKANRYGENRLADAETVAALNWAAFADAYPADDLLEGWRDTLFSHFHDILPGSGVHDTRTYTHGLFQKTMAMTSMAEARALRALAARIDTSAASDAESDLPPSRRPTAMGSGVGYGATDGGLSQAEQSAGHGHRPFVVFNPTAFDRREIVEATVWDPPSPRLRRTGRGWRGGELGGIAFSVRTPDGDTVPAQTLETGNYWGHDFVRLAFPVQIGSLGYGLYTVIEEAAGKAESGAGQIGLGHHCGYSFYERSPEGLQNDLVSLEIDPASGGIRSLALKDSGLTLIGGAGPAAILEYAVEKPHGMSSWLVDHTGPVEVPQVVAIARRLDGPYKASIEVKLRVEASEFTLTYELRAGDPNVYLTLAGTWFERGSAATGVPVLRLALPLDLEEAAARYEIPFGAVDRCLAHGEEVPALNWAQATGKTDAGPAGCLLLNDSKHGHSLTDNVLRLTLIRSSYSPDPLPEIGEHRVNLALRPFAGELPTAEAIRLGRAFNHGLRLMGAEVHGGVLPPQAALIEAGPDTVVLDAVKKAETEDALILRFFDPTGDGATAEARLNADILGDVEEAVEVDLLERPVANSSAIVEAGRVTVMVPPRGIASVRVKLKKREEVG